LYIAFHADCQYAGMMSVPLTLLAKVILRKHGCQRSFLV
jgi:hypothetical protein